MSGIVFWVVAITAYWLCARWFFFGTFGITIDGGGPSASYYWGDSPLSPSVAEWLESRRIRFTILYPYWICISIITFVGCGLTTWLVRLWRPQRSRLFWTAAGATFVLLLVLQTIVDGGTAFRIWSAPPMYASSQMVLAYFKGDGSDVTVSGGSLTRPTQLYGPVRNTSAELSRALAKIHHRSGARPGRLLLWAFGFNRLEIGIPSAIDSA